MTQLVSEDSAPSIHNPKRLDFGINISEGLVFRALSDKLGSLFVCLSTGHLFQLFLEHSGIISNGSSPYCYCSRLRRTGEPEAKRYFSTVYHIEEIADRGNPNKTLTLAVSHEGERPWIYTISVRNDSKKPLEQVVEVTGTELMPRATGLTGFLSSFTRPFFTEKNEGQIDSCKYLGNNLLCYLTEVGLQLEARIVNLISGEVICSTNLKKLDDAFAYSVQLLNKDHVVTNNG